MYKFEIIKKPYGYIVVNKDLNTHAHLPNYKGCAILLYLIKKDVEITDTYLQKAKERLIPQRQKRKKDKYINIQKGVVRK